MNCVQKFSRTTAGQLLSLLAVAGLAVVVAGCSRSEPELPAAAPLMTFDTTTLRVVTARDTIQVTAEVARTRDQQTMGLMERTALADSAGMIFVYEADQPATAAFWMFRTRIPLDIAFADSSGRIGAILQMAPCTAATAQACPTYPPQVPYRFAVEMNEGWFARHGVKVGDAILR